MIAFHYEIPFQLLDENKTRLWINTCVNHESFEVGEINYIFCNDAYLHKLNVEFLQHDTFTDIISFDYSLGKQLSGDVFISVERVEENAKKFNVSFNQELHRVILHGVLHYMGYKDKTEVEKKEMRSKENQHLKYVSN